eukprot:CAMPEP_0114424154 /NCGR_PEP_ID=MMETSP0103-20121206/6539_1 /TAXON_ID=37642 ORGANISM="Paraphysomonas imperforata, Strain PA2" /NCGR_SAMPLE_ID=MMETSP0103 /ASSEMBLY_ACC=CAM_ASM_000201 /LENGTH=574 /DNA_ID=CAMNT_0001592881 /DNA_START=48 /DNA_END=1775 /DNA_ORIENTATION=+
MKPTVPSAAKPKGARVVIPKKAIQSGNDSTEDKLFKENMKRYEQDLTILAKKIAECQGDTTPVPGLVLPVQPESLFVNNLRNSVDKNATNMGNENTLRLNMLERIMEKLAELDRVVLKKTDLGATTARPRRKSKDGSDLFSMPTHLLMIDRLLDVFVMSQRLQIIEKQKGEGGASKSGGGKELEKATAELEKLKKHLQEANVAKDKFKTIATDKEKEFENYKRTHGVENGKSSSSSTAKAGNGDSSTLSVIGDGKAIVTVEVHDQQNGVKDQSKEVAELKEKLAKSEQTVRDMEERMEILVASEQSTVNGIVSMTFALGNSPGDSVPTADKLNLKFLNPEAKKATDQLFTSVVSLVSEKSKAAVAQYNDILEQHKHTNVELDALKSSSQTELARKNAEILALQESLSKAYSENEKADGILKEVKENYANSRKDLIQVYEGKIQQYRADNASSASMKRQLEKAKASVEELEKKNVAADHKNIELKGSLDCLKSDMVALEKMNQNLLDTIKKMTNDASKNDFADTFEEVMREEMMAMKGAFEEKLKIARQQTEAMSKKRQSEISRIEGSRSSTGLR